MKSDRADVIVPAGDIFLTIAGILGSEYIYVPVIGLSDGIIDDLYLRNQEKLKVSYEQEETPESKTNKKDKKKSEKDKGKKAKPIDTTTEKQ